MKQEKKPKDTEGVLTNDDKYGVLTGRQNCDVCNTGSEFCLLPGQSFPIDKCVSCGGEIVEVMTDLPIPSISGYFNGDVYSIYCHPNKKPPRVDTRR
jgi:hypothetical protein